MKQGLLQDVENFFVAFERRNQIGASKFGARPGQHLASDVEPAVAGGWASRLERHENLLRNDDTGNFVV